MANKAKGSLKAGMGGSKNGKGRSLTTAEMKKGSRKLRREQGKKACQEA